MAVRLNLGDVDGGPFVYNRGIPVQARPYFLGQRLTKSKDDNALLLIDLVHTGKAA